MMTATPAVRVQQEPFDLTAEIAALTKGRTDIGAVVTFTGLCRDEGGTLAALQLEHYPGMAEAEIERIAREATETWDVTGLRVIHRYGHLKPGDPIVLVVATSSHREAAFQAANFIMDYLKSRAPFWKKESRADGQKNDWVEARASDDAALARWKDDRDAS